MNNRMCASGLEDMHTRQQVKLSLITAHKPGVLSKAFHLNEEGELKKTSGGQLIEGQILLMTMNIQGFVSLLRHARSDQAVCYGVATHDRALVVPRASLTKKILSGTPTIARDRDNLSWPSGAGVLMLDYDPKPEAPPLAPEDILGALYQVWPGLRDHPHVWAASASSSIYRSDTGKLLRGICGQRVYVPIADAKDIPRTGRVLFNRLWLTGHGRIDLSKSGALLERCIIDGAVWQPERLDFIAGAACGQGLEQRRPKPLLINSESPFIDSLLTLPGLTSDEERELTSIKVDKKNAMRAEAEKRRGEWVEERIDMRLMGIPVGKREEAEKRLREIYTRAVTEKRLHGDFVLQSVEHGEVTVAQILDKPDKFHNTRFADPLEPDYGNDSRIAWANLRTNGKPYIFSHAHGGQRYTLHRSMKSIRIEGGELHNAVSRLLELMRLDMSVFDRGGELVRMAEGRIYPALPGWLALHATAVARFERFDKRSGEWRTIDCPPSLIKGLTDMPGLWGLPKLNGLITAPTMMLSGRIIELDGFDEESGLYLDFPDSAVWPKVPVSPSDTMVMNSVRALWHPFEDFPFVDAKSRGVHLAALLTIPIRQVLPTAPGIIYTAPIWGSGKTLLARCLAGLVGQEPAVMPAVEEEDELRKRLLSVAREGSRTLLLDNISKTVQSDALCSLLTSSRYSDRVLGASATVSVPTAFNVILTGNNVCVLGDLNRRLLRSEIDPRSEQPYLRRFELDPLAYVQEHRIKLIHAALTILKAYLGSGAQRPQERLASFEQWSDLVRGAVIWVGAKGWLEVQDPVDSLMDSCAIDPETQRLGALLQAWNEVFGSTGTTVPEAIQHACNGSREVLRPIMEEIAGEHGSINSRRLGRWISERKGRIVHGRHFEHAESRRGCAVWVVKC